MNAQIKNLKKHILNLTSYKNRFYTKSGNKKAAEYIHQELLNSNLQITKDYFVYKKKKYYNVLSEIKGEIKKTYIVCAHFDSKALHRKKPLKLAPGADDNASGIAAILELIKILSKQKIKSNVLFIFFNLEEEKRIGSKHLAKKFAKNKLRIEGVINLDTIGTWKGKISKKFPLNYVSDKKSEILIKRMKRQFLCPIKPAKELWRDDQASFWDNGYKAIELTEDGCTKFMHTSKDTLEKLHFKNITTIVDELAKFFFKIK